MQAPLAPDIAGPGGLAALFAERAEDYATAEPFPHAVFEGLFDPEMLRQSAAEFAPAHEMSLSYAEPGQQVKSAENRWEVFGPATRALVAEMQSGAFLAALEALTGISGLIVDPLLVGAGQHQIREGGTLAVHADFNQHPSYGMARRLNALLYLNDEWRREWGGELELWDRQVSKAVKRVAPTVNTLVIFTTSATSYHGHPDPLRCPPDRTRKSLAFYYYTLDSSDAEAHSTLWQARSGERRAARIATSMGYLRKAVSPWVPDSVRRILRPHR